MPKTCCAVGCQNHNMMLKKLSFHSFPRDQKRFKMWVTAPKRDKPDGTPWAPSKYYVVCNEHFIEGRPSSDPTHPDYVPSILEHNKYKNTETHLEQKIKRHKSALIRKIFHIDNSGSPTVNYTKKLKCSPVHNVATNENEENIQPMYIAEPIEQEEPKTPGFAKPLEPSEREMFLNEMNFLRYEKDKFLDENKVLKDRLFASQLSCNSIEEDDSKCKYYTGLSWSVFLSIYTFLSQFLQNTTSTDNFPFRDQMLVTIIKLRFDIKFEFIAHQRGLAKSTVNDIFGGG